MSNLTHLQPLDSFPTLKLSTAFTIATRNIEMIENPSSGGALRMLLLLLLLLASNVYCLCSWFVWHKALTQYDVTDSSCISRVQLPMTVLSYTQKIEGKNAGMAVPISMVQVQ